MNIRPRKRCLLNNAATQGGDDMARFLGLTSGNGRWTLRVRVPDDVRPAIKNLEISKSFGAISYLEAYRLARIERADIDQSFAEAQAAQRQSPIADVSESELRHLARAYFHRLEHGALEVPLDTKDREVSEVANFDDLMSISQPQIDASLQRAAIEFARVSKIAVVPSTPAFQKLCEGIRRA